MFAVILIMATNFLMDRRPTAEERTFHKEKQKERFLCTIVSTLSSHIAVN